ncbi:MAG TPA: protein kinase [Turneriella sp.]|nr:protein kinase [Turneriella sp.]
MLNLLVNARQGDKFSIAKLISLFESSSSGAVDTCVALDKELGETPRGLLVGLTGAPGTGKSTLIQHLGNVLLEKKPTWRLAVVAVDPSSPVSGGALLGDRTRVIFHDTERTYFRSQASDLDLGGIGRNTFRVCRFLRHFFDVVLVESVGVGQSEIEIARLADVTLLALQPFSGDQIQFMKSGVMEMPQAFIITKCDAEDLARKSYHQLRASLNFLGRIEALPGEERHIPNIFQTSSLNKTGFEELADFLINSKPLSVTEEAKREEYFLKKELRYFYGEFGVEVMQKEITRTASLLFEERRQTLLNALDARWKKYAT